TLSFFLSSITTTQTSFQPSPGNDSYPDMAPMRAPCQEFVYRLVADMHPTKEYDIENIQGTGVSRSVSHIKGGTSRKTAERIGPNGSIPTRLADPPTLMAACIYYKLDARYTIKTNDGHHIYLQARGLSRPGPGVEFKEPDSMEVNYTQDYVEYCTSITFEAAGNSPYHWMNGIVAVGVLMSYGGAAVIDCWRLTNFPGQKVEDIYVDR
ncbi:hypothetical protein LB507_010866, partial [Fusarium sp. FIESC RH6]